MTYRAWEQKPLDRAAVRELTAAIAEQAAAQLEEQAMDEAPWSDEKYKAVLAAQQKENALLAGILAARGITDPTEALTLLAGEEELSDPMLLTDMDKACARILEAIDKEQTIVVYGDYDVDGVTATALLYQHLKGMGASVKCMLPSREGDGYGLSKNAIQSIHDKGCQLIVTVDNGISALEEAEFAASLGVDLIVTDHHLPHDALPKAVAVVAPRRADDHSPFKGLCGAGVAFKLCAALDGCPPEEMLDYCGDLAAVGTVADVMPLTGENRTLVKAGLKSLQQTDRPGISALLEEVGLEGKPITAENVSYAIAPRINAAGRMDNAVTALQLVLCEDEERAEELAHKLNEINVARQETEQEIVKAAQEQLDAEPAILEDRVILIWGRDWHPGVIGIVASRLVEKTGRPVIVVSVDEHGEGKGSGRSVQGFNLHECIASCEDILLRFGGHAMAAGLSVREENLPELRRRLNEWAARECAVLFTPPLECDLSIHLDRITVESVRRLEQLAPYGAENPTPVFVLEKAVIDGIFSVSEGKHCRLRLRQGNASIYAVGHPMNVFYGYRVDGIIQEGQDPGFIDPDGLKDRPGELKYVDLTGDYAITPEDRCIIGDPNPDFTASLNLSLRWKNLDLSVFLYGVYGNDVLYNNYTFSPRVKAKRWTPDNPTNDFPRLNNARQYWLSDYFLQDGSFLHIQNITLGYNLHFNRRFLKGMRIYANIDNVHTFTKFDGYDPEVGLDGIYWGGYPKLRKYTVGIDLNF